MDEIPEPEPVPPPVMAEMEIQTEPEPEPEPVEPTRSPSPDTSSAASSSTAIPSTPKAAMQNLDLDQPPAYSPSEEEERKLLHKWHEGLEAALENLPDGISQATRDEWKALKEELGVDCTVIDKLLESVPTAKDGDKPTASTSRRRLSGKITNIYNTYIYPSHGLAPWASHVIAGLGGAAVVALIASSMANDNSFNVPGGVSYQDRVAWSSYNTLHAARESFDGPGAVVRGVLDDGAWMVQGWPT
jgi:hypothetical protein